MSQNITSMKEKVNLCRALLIWYSIPSAREVNDDRECDSIAK